MTSALERLKNAYSLSGATQKRVVDNHDLILVLELIAAADDMPDCEATQRYRYPAEFTRLQAAVSALTESTHDK